MTRIKRRLGLAAAFFLVGALILLPVSAGALPSVDPAGDDIAGLQYKGEAKDKDTKEKAAKDQAKDEAKAAKDQAKDEAKEAKDQAKDEAKAAKDQAKDEAEEAKDQAKDEAEEAKDQAKDEAEEAKDEAKAAKDEAKDRGATGGSADPAGVATGSEGGPVGITPSGALPTEGGLGSVDTGLLPTHLRAAIVMFDQDDEAVATMTPSVEVPRQRVSGNVTGMLAPVLPPMLTDVVVAPIIVIEALIEAMASSGQALVIPLIAGAAGFFAPGLRRKDLLARALDPDPGDSP